MNQHTSFTAREHGFCFRNFFEYKFPVEYRLPYSGKVCLGDIVYGLCGGMSFSALDYFHKGTPVPEVSSVSELDTKIFGYLWDRQLDSLGISVLLKLFQWMLMEDTEIAVRMARYELPKLRRSIDRDKPVVLALIRVKGLSDPTKNHQVVASGYSYNPESRQMQAAIYDPNHPGDELFIYMDLVKPSKGINITQSSGEELRGFFLIPYKPHPEPPLISKKIPEEVFEFDVGIASDQFILHWPVDSSRVNQYFGENPALYRQFGLPGHEGLDLYAPTDANVYAAADGEVYRIAKNNQTPYGYQIRIKHTWGGKVFKTIYAHLASIFVDTGQRVKAGELIGKADNTGNSFGSHLHMTLKLQGAHTPGYPEGIIDPMPYLRTGQSVTTPRPDPLLDTLPEPSGLTVYTSAHLNLRERASINSRIRGTVPSGEGLCVHGDLVEAQKKVGQEGEWLLITTASGLAGYAAAWYLFTIDQGVPVSDLVVYPIGKLNLRAGPATAFETIDMLDVGDPLSVLGDRENSFQKIGKKGDWLFVQTEDGKRGFVAAWLVQCTGQLPKVSGLHVLPTHTLNIRARPGTDSNVLTVVSTTDKLDILGDRETNLNRIGKPGQWIRIRTQNGQTGYAAAWLVVIVDDEEDPPMMDANLIQVFPTVDLNVRAQPALNSPRIGGIYKDQPVSLLEQDISAARNKIGIENQWIHVLLPNGKRGWVAAWYLREI